MAIDFRQDRDRNVIPYWRLYGKTVARNELSSTYLDEAVSHSETSKFRLPDHPDISDYIDYIFYNITTDNNINIDDRVRDLIQKSNYPLVKFIISFTDNDHAVSRYINIQYSRATIYTNIALLKRYTREYPRNAIPYVDMALLYTLLGQITQAEESMLVALHLAPNSRYIVRSAIRLFLHSRNINKLKYSLRKTNMIGKDPWVTASALSAELVVSARSKYSRYAKTIIEQRIHTPHSISELAAAYAKYLYSKGRISKSKKYMNIALEDPNENALAQIMWMSKRIDNYEYDISSEYKSNNFEAKMLQHYYDSHWQKAIICAEAWFRDAPFSNRPLMYASSIAINNLGDYSLAIDTLQKGHLTHYNNPDYANNLAYAYAHINSPKLARDALKHVRHLAYKYNIDYFVSATYGMIDYRENNQPEGFQKYHDVITSAIKDRKNKIALLASLNVLREEILYSTRKALRILDIEKIENYLSKAKSKIRDDACYLRIIKEVEDAINENIKITKNTESDREFSDTISILT